VPFTGATKGRMRDPDARANPPKGPHHETNSPVLQAAAIRSRFLSFDLNTGLTLATRHA